MQRDVLRVDRDDAHVERRCALRDLRADAAETDDQDGLAAQLDTGQARIGFPLPPLVVELQIPAARTISREHASNAVETADRAFLFGIVEFPCASNAMYSPL